MNVIIRTKPLQDGRESIYLDVYFEGDRHYEFLKLYLLPGKAANVKKVNRETIQLAEAIKAKRLVALREGAYEMAIKAKKNNKAMLLEFFSKLVVERKLSKVNWATWHSAVKHLNKFVQEELKRDDLPIRDITPTLLEAFKTYLSNELSANSAHSYFNKIRSGFKEAVKRKVIRENPAEDVKGITPRDPEREFLTIEEVRKLADTPCDSEVLKQAFLFSCFTGIRWSDIATLRWNQFRKNEDGETTVVFRQRKTQGQEYLPVSDQALTIIGDAPTDLNEKVFKNLKYSAWNNVKLSQWVMKAGITKHITFHCARHTFATLLLTYDTDIYTASKLLGHRDLKTTQIYAKIVDKKKVDAINKLPKS